MVVDDGCSNSSCFNGIFPDAFHELQRIMNFSYTMRWPKDGEWGQLTDDGTWTGIIGGEIDKICFVNREMHTFILQCGQINTNTH